MGQLQLTKLFPFAEFQNYGTRVFFQTSFNYFYQSLHSFIKYLVILPLNCSVWVKCLGFLSTRFGRNFWPFPPDRTGVTVGRLGCTRLFSSDHKCLIGIRSGLCDGQAKTLTLLSFSHFETILAVCFGSLSIGKIRLRPSFNFPAHVFRCCSIFPHLFWEVHQSIQQQHKPTT